jgi:hypothetical protein
MTNNDRHKPEGAPERSHKAGVGAPSGVDGNGPKRLEALYRSLGGNTNAEFVLIIWVLDVLGLRLVPRAKAAYAQPGSKPA